MFAKRKKQPGASADGNQQHVHVQGSSSSNSNTNTWAEQEAAFLGTTNASTAAASGNPTATSSAASVAKGATARASGGQTINKTSTSNVFRRYEVSALTIQQQRDAEHEKALEEAAATIKKEFKSFRKAASSAMSTFSTTLNAAIDDVSATATSRNYPGNGGSRLLPPLEQSGGGPYDRKTEGRTSIQEHGTIVNIPAKPTQPTSTSVEPLNYAPGRSRGGGSGERGPSSLLSRVAQQVSSTAKQLGVPSCVVCGVMSPPNYQYHPFFPKDRACAHHGKITKCCSCHRFEPSPQIVKDISEEFADLQDHDRRLCPACMRTVVLDTEDTIPVWNGVLDFFDTNLYMFENIPTETKCKMQNIPILMVGHDGLNDPSVRGSGHGGGNTRGLCMYEYRHHPMGGHLKNFLEDYTNGATGGGGRASAAKANVTSVLDKVSKGMTRSQITAILCLKGLPKDLAGSILAHEATHAWFKLHPAFDPRGGQTIPIQVEEGCCQLMAFLYLNQMDALDKNGGPSGSDYDDETGQPTNKKLRQYFRFCIESDTSEVYGDGFRLAADAYAKLGSMQLLLEHVVTNFVFPTL
jgi:hypothetical protein